MKTDNGQSQEAQTVRQKSEFIKRVEDFARFMDPEYITDNDRSLCIIAGDCLDRERGVHAMAHIMIGHDRVTRCAIRSMMEDNDKFSSLVHELCDNDGEDRSVEDIDEEIARKQKNLKRSIFIAVLDGIWSVALIALQVFGIAHLLTTISSLLLMALCGMFIGRNIKTLRMAIARLKQLRKRAVGRQKMMSRVARLGDFLRHMREQIEEDAADEDDDEDDF